VILIKDDNLSVGQKIKIIRESMGMSQEKLGEAISYTGSRLSQIENEIDPCSPDMLLLIKKALNIENMPLLDSEHDGFKDRLNQAHRLIGDREFGDAKSILDKLAPIAYLTFEVELNHLYSLCLCRLLINLEDIEPAEKILNTFDSIVDELSNDTLYYYYYNKGSLGYRRDGIKNALHFYLKAFELAKSDIEKGAALYYSIVFCYSKYGSGFDGTLFFEGARELYYDRLSPTQKWRIDNVLASSYIGSNHLQYAKKLLEKCHTKALKLEDKTFVGIVLANYGYMYRKARDYNAALENLDAALVYFEKGSMNHLEVLYQKARCYIEMGSFLPCAEILKEGKKLSQNHMAYPILFESLDCLTSLTTNKKSAEYLETVAIPYLIKRGMNRIALDYCTFLLVFFEKKKSFKNSFRTLKLVNCIREEIMEGGRLQ